MARLEIHLLGKIKLLLDGKPVETDRRKALALLVYLACSSKPQRREHLADLFWPEFDREHAYAYLRRTLWEINQMLGEGWLDASREQVALKQPDEIWMDSRVFERNLTQPAASLPMLEEAVALYEGEFMPGFSLRDSPGFEQWQLEQNQNLHRLYIQTLGLLSQAYAKNNQFDRAIKTTHHWLAVDALDEDAYRNLMRWYASSGQRSQALKTYQDCIRVLEQELGAAPEAATTRLYEQILKGQFSSELLSVAAPPPPSPIPPSAVPHLRSHLPLQPTRFVGRAMELLEIRRLLTDPTCRLLTLLGPGGMGKTRLSIEAANQLLSQFAHGVHFIALASLSSPDLIISELACVLELAFSEEGMGGSNDHITQLLDYLRPRQLLLVMDNFEHLLQGADLIGHICSAAPGVKVLATSRERLNLPEEWIFEIEGMSYPVDERLRDLETYSSVQLFISAARRSQPHFQIQLQDQVPVARICRLLQGMPLGIELAASWVRMLSPLQIAAEIEHNLDFLTSAQRGTPARHRNLRAIFQHSWSLLTDQERLVYCKLAVFRGGFTHQAAGKVAGADLQMLNSLVDKSLVRHFSDGRFNLHEVLHHYAAERLDETPGLRSAVEKAHSEMYIALLSAQQPRLSGRQVKAAHAVLDAEFDNLRQAWLSAVRVMPSIQLIDPFFSLVNYIETRGRQMEGMELLNTILPPLREKTQAHPGDADLMLLLATTLIMLGEYELIAEHDWIAQPLYREGFSLLKDLPPSKGKSYALILSRFGASPFSGMSISPDQIERNVQEALQTMREANDLWGLALIYISHPDTEQTDSEAYQVLHSETLAALEIFTRLGSEWGQASCYTRLSHFINWRGNLQVARDYALKAAAIYRELGDSYRLISVQLHLGQIETALGHYEQAKAYYDDNIKVVTQLGRRYFIAVHQDSIGYIELLQGNLDNAEELYKSSLELYRALEHEHGIGMSLANLGHVALRRGELRLAEQLLRQGLDYQLAVKEPWGITVCLKKIGLVAIQEGKLEKAAHCWRQGLGLSLQFILVPEALEMLVYLAKLDELQGQRCRALQTLNIIQGNPSLPREMTAALEEQLDRLIHTCTDEELNKAHQVKSTNEVKSWIEDAFGIQPLRIDQITLPDQVNNIK